MACCIIAAFLLAQAMEMVRRWGVFWGVVAPREGEQGDTVYARIRAWLRRPQVRRIVGVVGAVEIALLGSWIYTAHGTHLYQLGDQAIGRLRGEHIIYVALCTTAGDDKATRIVLADDDQGATVSRRN